MTGRPRPLAENPKHRPSERRQGLLLLPVSGGRPPKREEPPRTSARKTGAINRRVGLATIERVADLAKSHAEYWEREAAKKPTRSGRGRRRRDWDAKTKAGHWRIIEKEIRAFAGHARASEQDL